MPARPGTVPSRDRLAMLEALRPVPAPRHNWSRNSIVLVQIVFVCAAVSKKLRSSRYRLADQVTMVQRIIGMGKTHCGSRLLNRYPFLDGRSPDSPCSGYDCERYAFASAFRNRIGNQTASVRQGRTKELPPANYPDQLPPKPDRSRSEASGES